jgi:hypothetical protein
MKASNGKLAGFDQKYSAPRHLTGFTPGPKAVGSFVPKLARKAFEKFGFAAAAVLTDWREIVGPEIAACTAPERLRWPKPTGGDAATPPGPRSGATLLLRVEPARALDVQYKTVQIVERINAYFGYRAITDIRLIQAPLSVSRPNQIPARRSMSAVPVPGAKAVLKASLAKVDAGAFEDADLRLALERLGSAVSAAPHRHT